MINRKTLIGLAAATFVLLVASAAMGENFGEGNAFLWTLADIVWLSLIGCALALVALTVAVLVRAMARSRHARSNNA
jgi:hypothetical protein